MKRFVTTGILIVLMTYALHAQHEYYFRFKIEHKSELDRVTRMISIDDVEGDTVYAYANDSQLKQFQKETDYSLTFLESPGAQTKGISMADSVAEMADWDKYPAYNVYVQMMEDYAASYPDICNLESIGETVDGRELFVLNISDNVGQEEDEPEFFYTSTMHGDETAGFVFMLRFIDSLLTDYGSNPEITSYINNIDIYINPNANPDGTYTDDNSTVSNATRSNANLVDLNRNFPDPQDGEHPDGYAWQPETVAMMDFAEKHNFVLSANFHGGAEVANYPWDTWDREHVDDAWLRFISHVYADPAITNSPSGYFTGISSDGVINGYDWYPISGGRQDYMNYFQQCREVTMEVSAEKLLSTDDLRTYWNYNRQSLFDYMEQSLYGIRGIVTDENGEPLEAVVRIKDHEAGVDSSMVFTDPDVGDYHRMIEPGTYDIIFSSFGYCSDTISAVTVLENESVRVNDSLKVPAQELLTFNPDSVYIEAYAEDADTVGLYIKNQSNTEIDYVIEKPDSVGWLSVDPMSKRIPVKDSVLTNLVFSTNGLKEQVYKTKLQVTQNYNDSVRFIPVVLDLSRVNSLVKNALSRNLEVECYPNPFKNGLKVKFTLNKPQPKLLISIVDETGKLLYRKYLQGLSAESHLIDVNPMKNLPCNKKILFLRIENNSGYVVKKLLYSNPSPLR